MRTEKEMRISCLLSFTVSAEVEEEKGEEKGANKRESPDFLSFLRMSLILLKKWKEAE